MMLNDLYNFTKKKEAIVIAERIFLVSSNYQTY